MTERDLYEVLGVDRGASSEEIKRSYRALARQLHPDANPDDPDAEARFKELALAYETLSDPDRRQRYDTFGTVGGRPGGGGDPFGGGLGDIFDAFFGSGSPFGGGGGRPTGPPRGVDIEVAVELDLDDVVFGCTRDVEVRTAVACETCEATGAAAGTVAETCGDCGGAGQVRQVRQSFLGQMVTTAVCPRCSGLGQVIAEPCGSCGGEGRTVVERSYAVDVPAGIDSGKFLRLVGRGAVGPRGGPAGDLYVKVKVRPHDRFTRHGDDLIEELHVPFTQAALGATVPYRTLDGDEVLVVPAGTQTGQAFRFRGLGVPSGRGRRRGDLLVSVVVDVPAKLSAEEAELIRQLAELRSEEVDQEPEGLLGRIRSALK